MASEKSEPDGQPVSDFALSVPIPDPGLRQAPFGPSDILAGRFQIIRFIARGGMGFVYEAEDLQLGGRLALKVIRSEIAGN